MKVLVTGGTNGMGKGLAKILAGIDNQTHEIIILGRSEERGAAVVKDLKETTKNEKISFVQCDLTKLSDVHNVIKEIHNQHTFLDAIFINAGLGYTAERVETEDGMDPHFQVNYLSQFMLTLNVLGLLEKSDHGGRVIFNVTPEGEIFWDDIQLKYDWGYEKGIRQAMVAKRMFYARLHNLYDKPNGAKLSFFGFSIPNTVWTNQINIIPFMMKTMARVMKFFGTFISIEESGTIMAPLFTETQNESLTRSGKLITWGKNEFKEFEHDAAGFDEKLLDKLWNISLDLCNDERTAQIAERL
ncbi:MAG: SDR family NAD(P)-dependent oxidoreductase [Anaerolineales bacterium]